MHRPHTLLIRWSTLQTHLLCHLHIFANTWARQSMSQAIQACPFSNMLQIPRMTALCQHICSDVSFCTSTGKDCLLQTDYAASQARHWTAALHKPSVAGDHPKPLSATNSAYPRTLYPGRMSCTKSLDSATWSSAQPSHPS